MASAQEKTLFAALYAREYNKFQEFAKSFRERRSGFALTSASPDDPASQNFPWDNFKVGSAEGEQAWVANKAYDSALQALSNLQTWAEQYAEANELGRADIADYTSISDTAP